MENYENGIKFEDFFNDRVRGRGLNLKKLSELSGIATKHLESLSRGHFSAMPSEPYFHGYLIRLGEILEFEPDVWWKKLKIGGFVKSSGEKDEMPKNRFLRENASSIIWAVSIFVIMAIYFGVQSSKIFGRPNITITEPNQNPATSFTKEFKLKGKLANATMLYVGGEAVSVAQDGSWEKNIALADGLNSVEIKASKFLGGETKIVEQIVYQAANTTQ